MATIEATANTPYVHDINQAIATLIKARQSVANLGADCVWVKLNNAVIYLNRQVMACMKEEDGFIDASFPQALLTFFCLCCLIVIAAWSEMSTRYRLVCVACVLCMVPAVLRVLP